MRRAKLFLICLVVLLVLSQFSFVSAAPSHEVAGFVSGNINEITITTDANSGESTYWVVITDDRMESHTIQLSEANALELHLVLYEDGVLVPNKAALNTKIDIPLAFIITPNEEEVKHPVASALATFFSKDVDGLNYELIMTAHQDGYGFGVIAQALWMTKKLGGDAGVLQEILDAKKTGNYGSFTLVDGTTPMNWGQFKKAVMDGDKPGKLGVVMSSKNKDNSNPNGNGGSNGNGVDNSNRDKDKTNNGNNANSSSSGNNGNKNKP